MSYLKVQMKKGESVLNVLKQNNFSSTMITKLRKQMGLLRFNNEDVRTNFVADCDGILFVNIYFEENLGVFKKITSRDLKIEIVYEDENIIIVDKPSGVATMPTATHFEKSLFSGLKYIFGEKFLPHIVTRLDRDTSGLMLIAKNSFCHSMFGEDLKNKITREYLALCCGDFGTKNGLLSFPISQSQNGMKRIISSDGKTAITEYVVEQYWQSDNITLVRLKLQTGRTHQIRVHLNHIQHSLCGDKLYNDFTHNCQIQFERQCLHSALLSFNHPITSEKMSFQSLKPDFLKSLS